MGGLSSSGTVIPYGAIVNKSGQLNVIAEGLIEEGAAAVRGQSWIISAVTNPQATPSGGLLSIINNDPSFNLKIFRIYVYFSRITGTNLDLVQSFTGTKTGGVDITATGLVQKNRDFATSSVFNLQLLSGTTATALTYTNDIVYHPNVPMVDRGFNSRNMNGTNATNTDIIGFSVNVTQIEK